MKKASISVKITLFWNNKWPVERLMNYT